MDKKILIFIPLVLSSFTSLWNITGFPSLHVDEGHYMRKAIVYSSRRRSSTTRSIFLSLFWTNITGWSFRCNWLS